MKFLKNIFSKEENQEPEIVLSEISPHGNFEAIVEQDDRVAFLYLNPKEKEFIEMKSCWVRNLRKAPEALEAKNMQKGIPPMLPKEFCQHPEGQPPL